jgi:hypothetical protein
MLKSPSMQGSGQRARTLAGDRGAEASAGTIFFLFFFKMKKQKISRTLAGDRGAEAAAGTQFRV